MSGEFQSCCFDAQCAYLTELEILSKQRSYTLMSSGLGAFVKNAVRLLYVLKDSVGVKFL